MPSTRKKLSTDPNSMICIDCGYSLVNLRTRECPECGRPFDPGRMSTYQQAPQPRILTRLFRFDAAFWLIFFSIYVPLLPLYSYILGRDAWDKVAIIAVLPAAPLNLCIGGAPDDDQYFWVTLPLFYLLLQSVASLARTDWAWQSAMCILAIAYAFALGFLMAAMTV